MVTVEEGAATSSPLAKPRRSLWSVLHWQVEQFFSSP